jgi:serine/threonine protein phosphatase 1
MKTEGRTIAIGDIHGCAKALATLIEAIQPTEMDTLVFLGDYIDRGPDSRGVLDQVIALSQRCTVVPLLGNHEEMLLAVLDGGQSEVQFWLKFGGATALASYGWNGGPDVRPADVRHLVPGEHVEFLKTCRDYYETVNHIFVHAYYEPKVPLHEQNWKVLRWVSLPTNPKRHCSWKTAVVGHTPQHSGEVLDLGCALCIDTYCHGGGWLTALEVETGQVWRANEAGELRQ